MLRAPTDGHSVIVTAHVALGGLVGAAVKTRARAVTLGVLSHFIADACPHEDIESRAFEIVTGVSAIVALAAQHGPLSRITLAAAAAAAPDLEHVLPTPRPGGRQLFPSHRWPAARRSPRVPVVIQLMVASLLLTSLLARRKT